jgi:dethiobiotin synthetase
VKGFTIVGTHTNCGKTFISCSLLRHYNQQGLKTVGFKPVASGSFWTQTGWKNSDTLELQSASSLQCSEKEITPFSYQAAIAPHFAAKTQGLPPCTIKEMQQAHEVLLAKKPDIMIVESAGGILSPLSDHLTSLDLCNILGYPAILVVEISLGCLNEAQLTLSYIQHHRIPYAGWIANFKDPTLEARYAIAQDLSKRLHSKPLIIHHDHPKGLKNRRFDYGYNLNPLPHDKKKGHRAGASESLLLDQ